MDLDEHDAMFYNIFSLVRNQVRMSPMGESIDLDHKAVLDDIRLYVAGDKVKETFERVLEFFHIEREFSK